VAARALLPVLAFAASGAAFALANLILARYLPEREYAVATLVLALINLGAPIAAAGLDGVAVRGGLRFGRYLLTPVLLAATLVAAVVAAIAAGYHIGAAAAVMAAVATIGGGALTVAAAEFQRRQRFWISLGLLQSPNLVLLIAAIVAAVAGVTSAGLPLLIATVGFIVPAVCAWWLVLRGLSGEVQPAEIPWREARSLAAANASIILLVQLDRLIIPYLLPLSALATYGALSAVVGSFFSVMQRGVGYSLLPRLSGAPDVAARRRLVAAEARLVAVVVAGGTVLIWLLVPVVERWLLDNRYQFSNMLVGAAILAGWAKLLHSFGRATVTALADARELAIMSAVGWGAVVVSAAGAAVGARWGLAGVILGVVLGWILRSAVSLSITMRYLRLESRPADSRLDHA
jgi:O-antigen/teichoic acid export membrane protein